MPKHHDSKHFDLHGRGDRIRTCSPLLPKQRRAIIPSITAFDSCGLIVLNLGQIAFYPAFSGAFQCKTSSRTHCFAHSHSAPTRLLRRPIGSGSTCCPIVRYHLSRKNASFCNRPNFSDVLTIPKARCSRAEPQLGWAKSSGSNCVWQHWSAGDERSRQRFVLELVSAAPCLASQDCARCNAGTRVGANCVAADNPLDCLGFQGDRARVNRVRAHCSRS